MCRFDRSVCLRAAERCLALRWVTYGYPLSTRAGAGGQSKPSLAWRTDVNLWRKTAFQAAEKAISGDTMGSEGLHMGRDTYLVAYASGQI
jgi:hypothetical protein